MASIFKRKRDAKKRNAPWYVAYNDHLGKRRMRKGFTDRGLTEQLAAKLENETMLRKRGLIDPEEEAAAQRRKTPIADLLASFEKSLKRSDNTQKHVRLTMGRIRRIVDEAGIETPTDIDI